MGLPKQKLQKFLFNAAEYDDMGGIPADHWCYRFWTCVTKLIDDSRFAGLYHPGGARPISPGLIAVSYTHLRAHETVLDLVCRLLLEKKKIPKYSTNTTNSKSWCSKTTATYNQPTILH